MKKRICIILSALLAASSIAVFPVTATESEDYVQGQAIACIETKTGLVQSNSADGLEWESLMELDSEENVQPEIQAQNGKFAGIPSGATITGGETVRELVLVTSSSMSTNALISELEKRDDVLFAEPNYVKTISSTQSRTAADYKELQWGLENSGAVMDGVEGYDVGNSSNLSGSDEVVIAVVDSGIDYEHENLNDRMVDLSQYPGLMEDTDCGIYGYNALDDGDLPSEIMDYNGHGTHCAGIIGANGEDGGTQGVMSDVSLLGVRVLDQNGSGTTSTILRGLAWLENAKEDYGVNIRAFNFSLGGSSLTLAEKLAIEELDQSGVTAIIASGNSSADLDRNSMSGAFGAADSSIVVNAMNPDGSPAYYTNYGTVTDIFAPGSSIFSTVSEHDAGFNSFTSVKNGTAIAYEGFEAAGANDTADPSAEQGLTFHYYDENAADYCGELVPTTDEHSFMGSSSLNITADPWETVVIVSEPIDISYIDDFTDVYGNLTVYGDAYSESTSVIMDYKADGDYDTEDGFTDYFYADIYTDENIWASGYYSAYSPLGDIEGLDTQNFQIKLTIDMNDCSQICIDSVGVGTGVENYALYNGTSMAAPMVTGAYGVLCAQFPDESNDKLSARIIGGAVRENQLTMLCETGGRLNIEKSAANPDPVIQSYTVSADTITLYGWFLGEAQGTVDMGTTPLEVESWQADSGNNIGTIRVKLPENVSGRQIIRVVRADDTSAFGLKYIDAGESDTNFNELSTPSDEIYNNTNFVMMAEAAGDIFLVPYNYETMLSDEGQYLYRYDIDADTWESLGKIDILPEGSYIESITGHNGSLYAIYTVAEDDMMAETHLIRYDIASKSWSACKGVDVDSGSVLCEYKGQLVAVGGIIGFDFSGKLMVNDEVLAIDVDNGTTKSIGKIPNNIIPGAVYASGDDLIILNMDVDISTGGYYMTNEMIVTDLSTSDVYYIPDSIRGDISDFALVGTDKGAIITALPSYLDDGSWVDTWEFDKTTGEWTPSEAVLSNSTTYSNNGVYVNGTLYVWGLSQTNEKGDFFRSYTFEETPVTPTDPTTATGTEPETDPGTDPATEPTNEPQTDPVTEPSAAAPTQGTGGGTTTGGSNQQSQNTTATTNTSKTTTGGSTDTASASSQSSGKTAKTGDITPYIPTACLALMSLGAMAFALVKRRKTNK